MLQASVARAASTADGTGLVTFTQKALNPRDPSLPITNGGGGGTTTAKPRTPAVVVNTEPEATKVTARQSTGAHQARLPQTSGASLPLFAVLMIALAGLGLAGGTLWRPLRARVR